MSIMLRLMFRLLEYDDAIDPNDLYPVEKIDGSLRNRLVAMNSSSFTDDHILVRIAEITASQHALNDLARHRNPYVRIAVADNQNASDEIKNLLSNDAHADVRFSIAENAHTSHELLLKLSEDINPFVCARANQTLKRVKATNIEQLSRRFKTKMQKRKFA